MKPKRDQSLSVPTNPLFFTKSIENLRFGPTIKLALCPSAPDVLLFARRNKNSIKNAVIYVPSHSSITVGGGIRPLGITLTLLATTRSKINLKPLEYKQK